jgi:8-oxo-dGTP diphosphatase
MALPKTPALTTDCVVFDAEARVLLIRRGQILTPAATPFQRLRRNRRDGGERLPARGAQETGIKIDVLRLVGVYSDPARDPRGHTVSVAYVTILPRAVVPKAGSDAAGAEWIDDWRSVELAFDHVQILEDAEALLKVRRRD